MSRSFILIWFFGDPACYSSRYVHQGTDLAGEEMSRRMDKFPPLPGASLAAKRAD